MMDKQTFYSPLFLRTKLWKVILRIVVLLLFSLLFKTFDLTFLEYSGFFSIRSITFSLLFILFGYIVWEGAILIAGVIDQKSNRLSNPQRLVLLTAVLLIYGLLVAYAFSFTYALSDIILFDRYEAWESFIRWSYEMIIGLFLFYCMLLGFSGIIFYYGQWHDYQLKTERLMNENAQAKYAALSQQIEPHFFFNSLSVLTNLVYKDPDLSATYITRLAQCYRYILDKKMENLVTISNELDFLKAYNFLLEVRHQDNIQLEIDIPMCTQQQFMLPPATLQMLIENAVKHNKFSAEDPMVIRVFWENNFLWVNNTLNKKVVRNSSTGLGLENIRKRYELNEMHGFEAWEEAGVFRVKLPVHPV